MDGSVPVTLDDLFDEPQTVDLHQAMTVLAREAQARSGPGFQRWFVLPRGFAVADLADETDWERADTHPHAA